MSADPSLCAWCGKPVKPEDQQARRDEIHWHAECFVKHLDHVDEIRGIDRAGLPRLEEPDA